MTDRYSFNLCIDTHSEEQCCEQIMHGMLTYLLTNDCFWAVWPMPFHRDAVLWIKTEPVWELLFLSLAFSMSLCLCLYLSLSSQNSKNTKANSLSQWSSVTMLSGNKLVCLPALLKIG